MIRHAVIGGEILPGIAHAMAGRGWIIDQAADIAVVMPGPGALASLVRQCGREARAVAIVLVDDRIDPVERAAVAAMIGALAVEVAPAMRVSAVLVHPGADPDAVVAALEFLGRASAVTGQALEIVPETA